MINADALSIKVWFDGRASKWNWSINVVHNTLVSLQDYGVQGVQKDALNRVEFELKTSVYRWLTDQEKATLLLMIQNSFGDPKNLGFDGVAKLTGHNMGSTLTWGFQLPSSGGKNHSIGPFTVAFPASTVRAQLGGSTAGGQLPAAAAAAEDPDDVEVAVDTGETDLLDLIPF